jgi:hypothetical protein
MEAVGQRGNPGAVHANGNALMKTVVSTPTHRGTVLPAPIVQGLGAIWKVRSCLLLQIAILLSMVSIHFGLLIGGYRHRFAGTAELLITAVLVAGLLLTWTPTPWSRRLATAAQYFGILGVLGGLLTIVLRIGPRTMLDLTLNAALLLTLIAGLAITLQKPMRLQVRASRVWRL